MIRSSVQFIRRSPTTLSLSSLSLQCSTKVLHRPMGSCFSKPTVADSTSLGTRNVILQEPSLSRLQDDAEPGRELAQATIEPSYRRRRTHDRVHSTPHEVRNVNGVEFHPTPRQRTKSSIASPSSSSRNPNPDHRQTGTGGCDNDRVHAASLTMTRALEDCSQTNWNEFSPQPAAQLYSGGGDARRLHVRFSTPSRLQSIYIAHLQVPNSRCGQGATSCSYASPH